MTMTPEEALNRYNKQIKRQNEHIKENYDRVSATLKKGTKDKILAHGYTLNNFVTEAVDEKLKALEREGPEDDLPDFMR